MSLSPNNSSSFTARVGETISHLVSELNPLMDPKTHPDYLSKKAAVIALLAGGLSLTSVNFLTPLFLTCSGITILSSIAVRAYQAKKMKGLAANLCSQTGHKTTPEHSSLDPSDRQKDKLDEKLDTPIFLDS